MAIMHCTALSTVFSQGWSTTNDVELSGSMVCCHLLSAELVTPMLLHQLPLSRNQQCLVLQWAGECRHWCTEWQNVFSDESCFNLSYNDNYICVRCCLGEHNLRPYIVKQHSKQMPSVRVWGTTGCNMQSCLLQIQDNLNSNHYIREVLGLEILLLLQATPHSIFQQENFQPYVARKLF